MMRFPLRIFFVAAAITLLACGYVLAQETFLEPSSSKSFPKEVSFSYRGSEYKLVATGATEYKRTNEKASNSFFTIAHYMQNPPAVSHTEVVEAIFKSSNPKQIILNLNRETSAKAFTDHLKKLVKKRTEPATLEKIKPALNEFLGCFFDALKKDDRCIIRWLPDGKTMVSVPGEPDKIISLPAFAPAFWRVWFGNEASSRHSGLVSLLKS